jgi:hypothetical protein
MIRDEFIEPLVEEKGLQPATNPPAVPPVEPYLRDADLRGAYGLSGASLRDTDLRGADLRGAVLDHNDTIIYACLGGYQMHIQQMSDGVRVIAGCRHFKTIEDAEAHWAEGNEENWSIKTSEYGGRQRRMLAFLAYEARQRGWIS